MNKFEALGIEESENTTFSGKKTFLLEGFAHKLNVSEGISKHTGYTIYRKLRITSHVELTKPFRNPVTE